MNIHEHQAKQILKKYGAAVPNGVFGFSSDEIVEKAKKLNTEKYVLKAQIHAGGRGKAGGVKILDNIQDLTSASKEMLGKVLITHQTGPAGKEVKRLYVEESSNIKKEFYLSCLVDRASSKIAFISSDQGGMNIEEVAKKNPEKILNTKVNFKDEISKEDCEEIIKIFDLNNDIKNDAILLIKSIYKMFISTNANMVEINPLILTKEKSLGFIFETEEQVEKHLDQYTDKLPENDKKSREILLEIKKDETKHKETARELGSTKLSDQTRNFMSLSSRVMKKLSFYF